MSSRAITVECLDPTSDPRWLTRLEQPGPIRFKRPFGA